MTDQDARVVVTNDADFRHSHLLTGSPARLLVVATGNIGNDDLVSTWRIRALPLCRSSRGSSGGVGFREPAVATGGDRWWQSHNDDGVPAAVGCASPFTQGGSQGPMIYERPCAHCGQMILTPETAAEPLCLDCDPALAGDAEAE